MANDDDPIIDPDCGPDLTLAKDVEYALDPTEYVHRKIKEGLAGLIGKPLTARNRERVRANIEEVVRANYTFPENVALDIDFGPDGKVKITFVEKDPGGGE